MGKVIKDNRGEPITIYMSKEAINYIDVLVKEQAVIPKPGRGRIVEELLMKEKSKREKRKASELEKTA